MIDLNSIVAFPSTIGSGKTVGKRLILMKKIYSTVHNRKSELITKVQGYRASTQLSVEWP